MARDAIDIRESLGARVMRPRAVQRLHEDAALGGGAADGAQRKATEAMTPERQPKAEG